jgi:hypothetical protein
MNQIKTIYIVSLFAAVAAHAADSPAIDTSYIPKVTTAAVQTAVDLSDNRGVSLLLDDKFTTGQVVVSGVSKIAKQAGVRPGDVLASICSQPANLRHYSDLQSVAGTHKVEFSLSGHTGVWGTVPLTAVKDNGDNIVLTKSLQLVDSAGNPVTAQPGENILKVCVPVSTISEVNKAVAPFDWRKIDNHKVSGGWLPMEYRFNRKEQLALVAVLTADNPPSEIKAK